MNISIDESEQREGFIVLLDVLGSRGYWLRNEPKLVVKNFSEIVETIEYWKAKLGTILKLKNIELNLSTHFFSDTIMMIITPEKNADKIDYLKRCSFLISSVIIKGIDLGILLRGTISFGKFYESGYDKHSFTIGPAIDEAADWYNSISLIGSICSPSVGLSLDAYTARHPDKSISKYFIKHPILLKNKSTYNGWTLSWPVMIHYYLGQVTSMDSNQDLSQNLRENKSWLLDKFSNLSIGVNDFEKFENTIKLYETLIHANAA